MRTSALDLFRLSNIGKEEAFGELSHLAAEMLEVPIALVNVITGDVQRSAGACGLDVTSVSRDHAFCTYTIFDDAILVVPDAQLDERFEDSPLVTGPPFIRFYAGRPLLVGGTMIGALCIIDTKPWQIKERELGLLDGLAKVAERLVESRLDGLLNAESENRIDALVEAMPVAIAVHDASDWLIRTNALYRKTFLPGQPADLPIGLSFPELLELIEAVGPEIRIGGRVDWKAERLIRRRDCAGPYELEVGSRWLSCDEVVMEDESLVATFTDVTDLKERESALAAGSALLRSTLESLEEGIAVFDQTYAMIASSEAFFNLLELPQTLRGAGVRLEAVASSIGAHMRHILNWVAKTPLSC